MQHCRNSPISPYSWLFIVYTPMYMMSYTKYSGNELAMF